MDPTDDRTGSEPLVPERCRAAPAAAAAAFVTLFVVSWYWLPATRDQGSAPHDLLFYLGVLPVLVITAFWAPWRRLVGDPVMVRALLFIAYLTASALWSRPPADPGPARAALEGLATTAFVLAVATALRDRRIVVFRVAVVAAAASAAVLSIVRLVQGHGYPVDRLASAVHFEHPNLYAHYLGVAALLAVAAALRSDRVVERWAWLGASCILAVGVVLTRSRSATAALLLVLVVAVGLYLGRRAAAVVALALVIAAALLAPAVDGLLIGFAERGDAGRDVIYHTLIERVGSRWLVGAGIGADDDVVFEPGSEDFPRGFTVLHPHSALVGTFYYGGLVGLALLLALVVAAVRRGVDLGRRRGDWDPLLLLLFGGLCLLTDGHRLVSNPHLSSWLLFWLPVGLAVAAPARSEPTGRAPARAVPVGPDLGLVAPPVALTSALAAAAAAWSWFGGHGPSLALLAATAALVLLLAEVLGAATALAAGLVLLTTPLLSGAQEIPSVELVGLAVALVGTRLWLQGADRGPRWVQFAGGVALAAAGLLAPAAALGLTPPLWWWTRSRGAPHWGLLAVGALWVAGWVVTGAFADGLRPTAPRLELWLSTAAAIIHRVVGLAGVVPAAAGALLGLGSRRRWLGWWLFGSGILAVTTVRPADPGGNLLPLAASLAAATAVGALWLGAELARVDRPPDDTRPLAGRRLMVARGLVVVLLLAVVLSRLWPVEPARPTGEAWPPPAATEVGAGPPGSAP